MSACPCGLVIASSCSQHGRLMYAESTSQGTVSFFRGSSFCNLLARQLVRRPATSHQSSRDGVIYVLLRSRPFKVAKTVVGFVSISMIRLHSKQRSAQKGQRHQAMYPLGTLAAIFAQVHDDVANAINMALQYVPRDSVGAAATFSSDMSMIRNGVPALPSRDRFPFLELQGERGPSNLRAHRDSPPGVAQPVVFSHAAASILP